MQGSECRPQAFFWWSWSSLVGVYCLVLFKLQQGWARWGSNLRPSGYRTVEPPGNPRYYLNIYFTTLKRYSTSSEVGVFRFRRQFTQNNILYETHYTMTADDLKSTDRHLPSKEQNEILKKPPIETFNNLVGLKCY